MFGICSNAVICALKLAVGFVSGSVTVIADAVNNLSDAGSSAVTVAGFTLAARPADREQSYGHARYEYIGALVVAVIILIVGALLCKSSIEKIVAPRNRDGGRLDVRRPVRFHSHEGRSDGDISELCERHFLSRTESRRRGQPQRRDGDDRCAIAAVVTDVAGVYVDAYFGLAVSLFIVASSFKYILEAANPLIGTRPPDEVVDGLKARILAYDGVIGEHDLAVH